MIIYNLRGLRNIFGVGLIFLNWLVGYYDMSSVVVSNDNGVRNSPILTYEVDYDTEYVYNYDLVYGETKVVQTGVKGMAIGSESNISIKPVNEVIEVGRSKTRVYYGSTTGYGADCVGCSGTVACSAPGDKDHNLYRNGIYYNDSEYGSVRIVAADNSLFSCGTIIKIDNKIMEPFMAIVMDTGSAMRNAYKNNNILIDIAFMNESDKGTSDATNKNNDVRFSVYRNGWE